MVVYEYYRHESQQLCSKLVNISSLNTFVWILWFIQSTWILVEMQGKSERNICFLISHGPPVKWEIESGEWNEDNTMRLISIITMTFGK